MRERLRTIIASALDIRSDEVPVDAGADTLQAWDSIGQLAIITAVEEQLGLRFTTAEIPELNSIDKLLAALAAKGLS